MAILETLEVQFNASNTTTAIKNITMMAQSVRRLANSLQSLEASKFSQFASGMSEIAANIPNGTQANSMTKFADAIAKMTAAISGSDITGFASNFSAIGQSTQSMGNNGAKAVDNLTNTLKQAGKQAEITSNAINEATSKASRNGSLTPISGNTGSVNDMVASLDRVASRTERIKSMFKGIVVPTKQFKSLEEQANKVAVKYDELRNKMTEALSSGNLTAGSSEFKAKEAELEALKNKYDELILKQKELALIGGGLQLNPTVLKTVNAFKSGFSQVTNIVKNGLHAAIRGINSQLKSFVGHVRNAASAMKKTATGGVKVTDMAKKLSHELLRVSKMLKLMVTRMALRAVIKEVGNGFKSLALHCETFNQSMSSLINGSKKLGYSFAAMVEPLINALAPALIYLINLITRVINALNQLFTALGGGTVWHRAKNFTDSWADSIKDANGKAKELKKTVLGFDELNQLQDNKNSGGGGGDITDMFEDVKIDPKWKEFADWLKDMWKNKDFTELGKLIGTKLKDFLDSIPWDRIRKTSNDLGKAIATLINGLVEVEGLGESIGRTLAQGVNTVFEFFNGFVHNLHWDSVGKFIADTFNGFFENIDWKLIKDTVITGMKGLADAIWAFIQEFHWDNISDFIRNGLDTIAKGIKAFFEEKGFDKDGNIIEGSWAKNLGKNIGDQLSKVFRDKKLWREVGEALGDLLQGAIDFLSGFVSQLKVEDIRSALKELVDGFFDKVNTEELGKTLANIIDLVIEVAVGFWRDNKDRLKKEGAKLVKGFFDNLDQETKDDIKKIVAKVLEVAVLAGIAQASATILGSAIVTGFKNKLVAALFGTSGAGVGAGAAGGEIAKEAGTVGTAASTTFASTFIAGIKAALIPVAVTAAIGYGVAIPASKKLEEILSGTQEKVDDLKNHMDTSIPSYDEMSRAARAASHNQKEYAEKMQEMYNSILRANPELYTLARALDDNKISIKNNADTLVQINDGLKLFRDNGGDVNKTLDDLHEMYGKVNSKTEFFFETLGRGNEKASNVKDAMDDFNATLKETESKGESATKIYKNHTEVLADMKKAQEETTGIYKTHLEVIKENASHTEILKKKVGDTAQAMPQLDKALQDSQKVMQETSEEAKKTGDEIINGIKEPIKNATFDDETSSVFQALTASFKKIFGIASPAKNMNPIGENIILGVDEGMANTFGDFTKTMEDFYNNYVKTWFTKDKWSFSGVAEGLKKTFEEAKNGIKNVWNSIADTLNGDHSVGSSSFKINLPKFATGGFPEDGLFMANHNELVGEFSNGRTAVANNAQIVAGIENGVYRAMSAAMSNGGSPEYISNTIMVDGIEIARSITKAQQKENRRYAPAQG